MIEPNHPRKKNHLGDASIGGLTPLAGGALVWLGVTLLGVAVLVRSVLDMAAS